MRKREADVVRTLRRVRDFVANEATDVEFVHRTLLPRLEAQLARLDALAAEQDLAMRLQLAATRRQNVLAEKLRSHFVVPLSRVSGRIDTPRVGIGRSLRAPHKRIPRERLVQAATAMADTAQRFEPLISSTLGPAFLPNMRAAAAALGHALVARNAPVRRHVVARASVEVELRRARRTVRHMDDLLDIDLSDSPSRLAVWRRVKRYE